MLSTREYKNNKFERPFSSSHPMHITLRTRKGNLRRNDVKAWLDAYLPFCAKKNSIRLLHYGIVGNHLHLAVIASTRKGLNCFLRTISGVIARRVLGAEKGRVKGVKFWEGRPYSRILTWGRELENVIAYIERNVLEASGRISYVNRKTPLLTPLKEKIQENLTLARFDDLSRQMSMKF